MPDPSERLVNLALFLASRREYVSAEGCRAAGLGYPDDQDDAAFLRMFERDKDALRAAGLVIDVRKVDEVEAYRLDVDATFQRPVSLSPSERAALRAAVAALAEDAGFPFGKDLARALAKLGAAGEGGPVAVADLSESGGEQGRAARLLAEAVQTRKRASFGYTNAAGERKRHVVEPYGVFFREGRWYLAGRDVERDDVRTYAVARMQDLAVNPTRPRSPDFDRPSDFDVGEHERLPFQFGEEFLVATVRFDADAAWRAPRLVRGKGTLEEQPDGSLVWHVEARDMRRLAEWLVDEGPGLVPLGPPELIEAMRVALAKVVADHA